MKKKLAALIVIVVLSVTLLAGCSMFPIDARRDYDQVVATVSYEGMTAVLKKGELKQVVDAYGAAYVSQYNMTAEDVVNYFCETLAKQKLLTLYAKWYVAHNGIDIAPVTDNAAIANLKTAEFLSLDEQRYCIEQTNKQFDDLWEQNIKTLEDEQKNNSDDEEKKDETPDGFPSARPLPSKDTEESTEYEKQDTTELPKTFEEYVNEKIDAAEKEKQKNMKTALNDLNKTLDSNFNTYATILESQYESRIVQKYQDAIGKTIDMDSDEFTADFQKRYKKLVNTDQDKYTEESDYSAALDSSNPYFHAAKGYGKVKSILLGFSDEQKSILSAIKAIVGDTEDNKELIASYREKLALGGTTGNAAIDQLLLGNNAGIKVNVSNPDYDAEKDKKTDAFTDWGENAVDYRVILYAMANDIAVKSDKMNTAANANGITDALQKTLVNEYGLDKAFTDWMYLVNDDEGMFSSKGYKITPSGQASSYVSEYTVLARALTEKGTVGSLSLGALDNAVVSDLTYAGETEILKNANGKTASITSKKMSSFLEDDEKIQTTVYTLTTAEGNSISYIVNDYGIHIVMLSDLALNQTRGTFSEVQKDGEVIGYQLNPDYLYDYSVKVTYVKDSEGNDTDEIEKIKVETRTIEKMLRETIRDEKTSDESTQQQIDLFKDQDKIERHDSVFNQLVKYLDDLTK